MMRPPLREDLLALRRVAGDQGRMQLAGLAGPAVADLVAALAGGGPMTACCGWRTGRRATRCTSRASSPRWPVPAASP